MAGTAFAGKGGGTHGKPGGGSTSGGGSSRWSSSTTGTATAPRTGATQSRPGLDVSDGFPYVSTTCVQGRTLVLSASAGFYDSYAWPSARTVPLATDRWTGGAADCTAKLYSMDGGSETVLATQTFHVGA